MFEKRRQHGFVINEENEFEAPHLCLFFFFLALSILTVLAMHVEKLRENHRRFLLHRVPRHEHSFENRLILINRC